MSLVKKLVCFGLRQAFGVSVDKVVESVEQRFTDHAQTLPRALARANDRAWQALAIALAGNGFLDQLKVFFASGDDQGVREQVGRFLGNGLSFKGLPDDFRKTCLTELRNARQA